MPIPSEILSVKRPVNSIVIAYGKAKNLYGVRQRIGCRNVNGRHIPVNGPVIGHIIDGKYVPVVRSSISSVSMSETDMKDWGCIAMAEQVYADMLNELEQIYSPEDSMKIYCISILRVCFPGIKDCELQEGYDDSFLSVLHPRVPLSRNTISTFLNNLGKTCSRITLFMRNRTKKVGIDHHLLVDGILKSDESKENSLSNFSRKAITKGTRDISVLYSFDLEEMELVSSKCFPGNMLDLTAYGDFIESCGISRGIIVGDKGFPSRAAEDCFRKHPDLHYLNPIKRNSKLIERHHMLEFTGILSGREGITWRKEKCSGKDKWLYSFRDAEKAAKEEKDYLARAQKNGSYDQKVFEEKRKSFGTVVLESDLDCSPEIIYKAYEDRWEIEIVMRYYKSACEFDENRVHDDYSVIGSEFCDFLSTVLTFRLLKSFDRAGLLKKMTYSKVMSVLKGAKKMKLPEEDWKLIRMNPSQVEMLESLQLLSSAARQPKRGRGRPRKTEI